MNLARYSANVLSAATTVGLEMAEYTVLEAAGLISVRVTMRGNSSDVVTVMFNTVSQTATGTCYSAIKLHASYYHHFFLYFIAQSDYTSIMTEICFPPGTSMKTIVVPVLNDDLDEHTTESFLVRLSIPTGQTRVQLSHDTATVRIEDDDGKTQSHHKRNLAMFVTKVQNYYNQFCTLVT